MKRLAAAIILLLSLSGIAHAAFAIFQTYGPGTSAPALRQQNFFGLTGSAWQTPSTYYVPGTGNPAISTSDYYGQSGVAWMKPFDLLQTACGSTGASIAAAKGRYAWFSSSDHGSDQYVFAATAGFRVGFSNDPGVPPSTLSVINFGDAVPASTVTVATITADISNGSGGAGNILNVTAVSFGQVSWAGASLSGSGVTTVNVTGNLTGQKGGIGTYSVNGAAQLVTSRTMTISQSTFQIYQNPYPVCNPDDPSFFMYVYAEGSANAVEHESGIIKSNDLVTWTAPTPSHVVWSFGSFGGWSSFQRVVRAGTGSWYSGGFNANYTPANVFGYGRWTSTDGLNWAPNITTMFNNCLPPNSTGAAGAWPCPDNNATQIGFDSAEPNSITIGAQTWTPGATSFYATPTSSRSGTQSAVRVPTDSNLNVLSSPAMVTIGTYTGNYPGPTFMQGNNSYVEDGIAHYYVGNGFPVSTSHNSLLGGATYLNGGTCVEANSIFNFTGSIAGTTLTVSSTPFNIGITTQIISGTGLSGKPLITAQLTGPAGGAGTYTVSTSQTVSSTSLTLTTCGGLQHMALDYYTEIVNSASAAGAAPVGVRASCASSTATINWYSGVLPTDTMRLYRGTTAGSQTTLVGDFTGSFATDTGMTLNAITYYKLVYLNAGVEKKNRVVSIWCSNSLYPEVNAHFTRAQAASADMSTCSQTFMDSFYGWLTTNGKKNNLLWATSVDFCVAKSGSVISKVFDMGATRLPKNGDYTPLTANMAYNATGINSKPAWVNSTNTAYAVYGDGRFNNIQRKTQITLFATYQKPNTSSITPFIMGEFNSRLQMQHASGTPGTINCLLADATHLVTATATVTGLATDVHSASCTFDGTNWRAWSDAAGGTAQTGLVIPSPDYRTTDMLTGQTQAASSQAGYVLGTGGDTGKGNWVTGAYTVGSNQAQYGARLQAIFDVALSGAEQTSLDALAR